MPVSYPYALSFGPAWPSYGPDPRDPAGGTGTTGPGSEWYGDYDYAGPWAGPPVYVAPRGPRPSYATYAPAQPGVPAYARPRPPRGANQSAPPQSAVAGRGAAVGCAAVGCAGTSTKGKAGCAKVGCAGKAKAGGKPCCDGCAKGGGCGSKVGGARGWRVGAIIASAEEKNALQAEVLKLVADVRAAEEIEDKDRAARIADRWGAVACASAGLAWDCATGNCLQAPDPTLASYDCIPGVSSKARSFSLNDLRPFLAEWEQTLIGISSTAALENRSLAFQKLVELWRSLGFETSAVPPAVSKPGIVEGAQDLGAALLAAAPWILGGVALLYVAPMLVPVVERAVSSLGRKK